MCISAEGIKKQLKTEVLGRNILVFDSVDSTNSLLKKEGDFPIGTLIVAKEQSGGRGRRGRTFWSPFGGIYMSVLYKPQEDFNAGKITSCVALAICKAIEKLTSLNPKIKWVNDVYINNKKVSGILCEAITNPSTSKIDGVVIGIGLNVEDVLMPDELKEIVTTLKRETENNIFKNELIAEIINNLEMHFSSIESPEFVKEIRERSCVIGKNIKVISAPEAYEAYAVDIDSECRLVVKRGEREVLLSSGEISIRNL